MKDEWREFKYDLANWKKKVPEELKTKTKTDHGQSKSCTKDNCHIRNAAGERAG